MPESIVPLLEAHLERHVAAGPEAPLFVGPKGRRASFSKAWHKALKETGVRPHLKTHGLRHLANTMAAKVAGSTLKDLMAPQADRAMAKGIDDELRQAMASGDDAPDGEADAG
jgi:integrase